ncbi:CD2-associated protein isoform X1 [Glossina fuscipes]|uniref:CD2-associated protein isoform X1 n=2 Tax=Glossina fuscipes TaxID=7396 RepID=A0A8U0WLQ1_9MUSC|nr:CD2-associated protein isoform X1 [Glossina fuscipes]XP_037885803.1 CD2-associated protein isoform X1 [Glossina fuscipes]
MDIGIKGGGGPGSGGVSAVVEYDYTAKEPDELDLVKGAIIHSIKQMSGGWWEGTLQTNGKTGMFPDNFVRVVDMNDDNTVILRDKSATSNRRCKVIYSYTQVNDDELSLAVGDVIEFLGEVEEGWWRGRLRNKIGVFPSNFVKVIEPSPVFASKRPPSTANSVGDGINSSMSTASSKTTSLTTANAISTKKTHRLSFHNSKEDLLSNTTTTTTTAATIAGSGNGTSMQADDVAPSLPPKPQREYCRVEFPYAPQNDDELELKVGDIIIIHSMELPDKGWWKGELRGKIGVFPDNFVKLIPPSDVSPLNDSNHQHQAQPQQSHRTAKSTNITNNIVSNATATASNLSASSMSTANNIVNSVGASTKSLIKKSGSTSSTHSSNRKDSFGSRDSLNDILSETGLPSGNVAAQRKSLESKNLDLTNASDAATRLALKKQQQQHQQHQLNIQQQQETKNGSSSSSGSNGFANNITNSMSNSSSELRKSNENVDDKTKTAPPPVLSKKPTIPNKKSNSVSSVAGNIFSGLKQKVKNVENKLTTAVSHDAADGLSSSKLSPSSSVANSNDSNVVIRRAATIAGEDTEFDHVERSSILTDMRAGRVKAPKRRPPSAAMYSVGESNNNTLYLNGSGSGSEANHSDDQLKSDDNSTSEEQLAKPKPREWERKKAPWMEELKASQVRKKTPSPNVEGQAATSTAAGNGGTTSSVAERTSKLFGEELKISNSSSNIVTTSATNTNCIVSNSVKMQQSMVMESSNSTSTTTTSKLSTEAMTKSLSAKLTSETIASTNLVNSSIHSTTSTVEDVRARPNSLSLRNRSLSPSLASSSQRSNNLKSTNATNSGSNTSASPAEISSNAIATTAQKSNNTNSSNVINNHQHLHPHPPQQHQHHHHHHHHNQLENNIGSKTDNARLVELELRVDKLETLVYSQQRTIDELVRSLRDETDRVKNLRSELDKYAQCVTQV